MQLFFCQFYSAHKEFYRLAYQPPPIPKAQKGKPQREKIKTGWSAHIIEIAANFDLFRSAQSPLTALEATYNANFDLVMRIIEKQNIDFLNSLT
jgi:hypothetical protein